jgi:hypothetical protein
VKDWKYRPLYKGASFGQIITGAQDEVVGGIKQENAEKILALRGSHAELVAALQAVMKFVPMYLGDDDNKADRYGSAIGKAQLALATAVKLTEGK